jgi:hypothetical protein
MVIGQGQSLLVNDKAGAETLAKSLTAIGLPQEGR